MFPERVWTVFQDKIKNPNTRAVQKPPKRPLGNLSRGEEQH
jgi:hypothetical protein